MVDLNGNQFGSPYFPGGNKGQGKLFRDPKPVGPGRYPRGYTPERMAEVRAMPLEITHYGRPDAPFGGHAGARHLQEVIARSKTPASDVVSNYNGDVMPIHTGMNIGASGRYFHHTSAGSQGKIELSGHVAASHWQEGRGWYHEPRDDEEQMGQTLLHELGHQRSYKVEHTTHSNYSTPTERGKEEAFADDNEMTRWRPDPRDVRRGTSQAPRPAYEILDAHQGIGGKRSHAAYLKARTTPIVRVAEARAAQRQNAAVGWQQTLSPQFGKGHAVGLVAK